MTDVLIARGADETERAALAELYWEAFAGKLSRAFPNAEVGQRLIAAGFQLPQLLVARIGRTVVGVCGYQAAGSGALTLPWSLLRSRLTIPRAMLALGVLALLHRSADPDLVQLDGICVDRRYRGRGIGSALLAASADLARDHGRSAVRLSVVDTNPRAEALYRRRGFVPVGGGSFGILAPLAGCNSWTVMQRTVVQ